MFRRVRVESRERIGVYHLLHYPWEGSAEPGQFVMARPAGESVVFDPFLARPFSVYECGGGTASLLVEPHGRGSGMLVRVEELEVSAPLGRGFEVAGAERVALVAGEGKVAPLKMLARRLEQQVARPDVFLVLSPGQREVAREFPGARVWGRVEGLAGYSRVYASGSAPALEEVWRAAGGARLQVAVEERMGCGNGSCHGCAIPLKSGGYARACAEGPVFDAEELTW
jgi:dihydroorotate dehydrogenase electron transfer subunit